MCNLHTPVRLPSKTRGDFKARKAASAHLYKQHAAEIVEQQIKCAHITIVNKLNQLLNKQEEYDAVHHKSTETDKRPHPASDRGKNHDLHKQKEMKWLSTQNMVDGMRYDNLWNTCDMDEDNSLSNEDN